jgi:hypothetical protein
MLHLNTTGIPADTARAFVASFYSSLAGNALLSTDSFGGMDCPIRHHYQSHYYFHDANLTNDEMTGITCLFCVALMD